MSRRPRVAVVGSANIDLTTFADRFPNARRNHLRPEIRSGIWWKGREPGGRRAVSVVRMYSWWHELAAISSVQPPSKTSRSSVSTQLTSSRWKACPVELRRSSSSPNGQNRILVVKGANDALKPADVDAAAEMLKSTDCIVLQFEIPLETVYYTVAFARKHGIRCILNPAPGQPVDMGALSWP